VARAHLLRIVRVVRRLAAVVGLNAKDEGVDGTMGRGLCRVIGIVLRNRLKVILTHPAETLTVHGRERVQADRAARGHGGF
jgi:hypothetical protein